MQTRNAHKENIFATRLARIALVVGAVLTCATSLLAHSAEAQYPTQPLEGEKLAGDIVVAPAKIEISGRPGDRKITQLVVANRTDKDLMFTISAEDIAGSSDLTEPVVLLGTARGPYPLSAFISVPEKTFTVPASSASAVPVMVQIPVDAEPGGLYGSVLVSSESVSEGTGAALVSRVGSLFFVTVEGDIAYDAELASISVTGKKHLVSTPVSFQILFENRSNAHLNPYGVVSITNIFGDEVEAIALDPWFALPSSSRSREIISTRTDLFGRYVATAQINRGYGDIVDTKSVVFWVLPQGAIIAAIAILALLVGVLGFFIRRAIKTS